MLFSWRSGSRVTASLRLTSPMFSSARGDSRWGCRVPRFERFMWRACLPLLQPQPSYCLWATRLLGPRRLQRDDGLRACSFHYSSAQLRRSLSGSHVCDLPSAWRVFACNSLGVRRLEDSEWENLQEWANVYG